MTTTTTGTLARYRAVAQRIRLPDGTRPLMMACPDCDDEYIQSVKRGAAPCPTCNPPGYVPIIDLRQGREVVPVGLILSVVVQLGCHLQVHVYHSRLTAATIDRLAPGPRFERTAEGSTPEAALVAALETWADGASVDHRRRRTHDN